MALLQQIGAENELALTYAGYGRLHQQQGDLAQARAYLTRALTIFERLVDTARTGADTPAVGALGRRVLAAQAWNSHVIDT